MEIFQNQSKKTNYTRRKESVPLPQERRKIQERRWFQERSDIQAQRVISAQASILPQGNVSGAIPGHLSQGSAGEADAGSPSAGDRDRESIGRRKAPAPETSGSASDRRRGSPPARALLFKHLSSVCPASARASETPVRTAGRLAREGSSGLTTGACGRRLNTPKPGLEHIAPAADLGIQKISLSKWNYLLKTMAADEKVQPVPEDAVFAQTESISGKKREAGSELYIIKLIVQLFFLHSHLQSKFFSLCRYN